MKRLILVAFVVVILLGGGGAAFYFLGGPERLGGGGTEGIRGKTVASGPVLLELDNMVIPVIRDRRIERHVVVRVTLELQDSATRDEARRIHARLRDALLHDLHDYYSYVWPQEEALDLAVLRHRIRRTSDRVIGAGKVLDAVVQGGVERASAAE